MFLAETFLTRVKVLLRAKKISVSSGSVWLCLQAGLPVGHLPALPPSGMFLGALGVRVGGNGIASIKGVTALLDDRRG